MINYHHHNNQLLKKKIKKKYNIQNDKQIKYESNTSVRATTRRF